MFVRALRLSPGLAVVATLAASPAHSSPPSAANSEIPCGIAVAGQAGGIPDPSAEFRIVVRGFADNPHAGSSVVIVFDRCVGPSGADDVRLAISPASPGTTVQCTAASEWVQGVTDVAGVVRFTLVGGGFGNGAPGYAESHACALRTGGCADVYADGVFLGTMSVARYDADGAGGVSVPDIAQWLVDGFGPDDAPRSDFDLNGVVRVTDLSLLLSAILRGASATSGSPYCR